MGLIDVAPTILHHFNLPIGKDMDGKVILDIFEKISKPKYIDSWEDKQGDFGLLEKEDVNEAFSDDETMEQLVELGYVERPDDDIAISIFKTKLDLKHNKARVYLGKKDYQTAKDILIELMKTEGVEDFTPYLIDLMTVCIGMKNYDDALKYLNEFKQCKTDIRYNIYFVESDIYKGKNQFKLSLEVLEKASKTKPNAEIYFRIGELYLLLSDALKARDSFEKAIEIEPDKAKFHRGMADAYYELGEYSDAADHAFVSIELVKYFPAAHYILGKSLEKLGDLENAKTAYSMAKILRPKEYHRADRAIENVEEKLLDLVTLKDQKQGKYKENQIIVVSGLPRSGTSLMMQMLDRGGLDMLVDYKRKADTSNPKGYYEYEPVMSIHKDNSWLGKAQNKTVKIVAPLLGNLDPKYRYKVVFMKRNLHEVIKSQRVMTGKDPDVLPVKLYNAYVRQLEIVKIWQEKEPGVEIVFVDYSDLLADPDSQLEKVKSLIGIDLDCNEMKKSIDKKLYRNKASLK